MTDPKTTWHNGADLAWTITGLDLEAGKAYLFDTQTPPNLIAEIPSVIDSDGDIELYAKVDYPPGDYQVIIAYESQSGHINPIHSFPLTITPAISQ